MKKLPAQSLPKIIRNHLSAPALLDQVRKDFEKIDDRRRYGQRFSLTDVLMSGLAIFGLKFLVLRRFLWSWPLKIDFGLLNWLVARLIPFRSISYLRSINYKSHL